MKFLPIAFDYKIYKSLAAAQAITLFSQDNQNEDVKRKLASLLINLEVEAEGTRNTIEHLAREYQA